MEERLEEIFESKENLSYKSTIKDKWNDFIKKVDPYITHANKMIHVELEKCCDKIVNDLSRAEQNIKAKFYYIFQMAFFYSLFYCSWNVAFALLSAGVGHYFAWIISPHIFGNHNKESLHDYDTFQFCIALFFSAAYAWTVGYLYGLPLLLLCNDALCHLKGKPTTLSFGASIMAEKAMAHFSGYKGKCSFFILIKQSIEKKKN